MVSTPSLYNRDKNPAGVWRYKRVKEGRGVKTGDLPHLFYQAVRTWQAAVEDPLGPDIQTTRLGKLDRQLFQETLPAQHDGAFRHRPLLRPEAP
jgi:hypothetical protein